MNSKIEKVILEYFNFVNPLPYDEVRIMFIEFCDMYDIKIISKDYLEYMRHKRNGVTVCKQISRDMEHMFPYSFHLSVVVKRTINKKDGVRTNS